MNINKTIKILNDAFDFAKELSTNEPERKTLIISLFNVMVVRTLRDNIKQFKDLMDCREVLVLEEEDKSTADKLTGLITEIASNQGASDLWEVAQHLSHFISAEHYYHLLQKHDLTEERDNKKSKLGLTKETDYGNGN